ncbi:MAG: hypothetical protein QNL43_10925 [Crocinitomicaceae bacterium]|tara:strand:+ start:85 stop:585 length:501 start_codon:yes stop_codon:yes gene_type:complete
MKTSKHLLALSAMGLILFLNIKYPQHHLLLIIAFPLLLGFCFNLAFRKRIYFKPYFMSNWNFLTATHKSSSETNISSGLMFEKMLEVLVGSNYKVQYSDKDKKEIFVTTTMSFKSWGENIYIDIEEREPGKTKINIISTALQVYTWGKNEQNFDKMVLEIEDSLIV